jgi:carnitine 3-dehydrogenase
MVGGGVIGGGWVARFLLHGWDVAVFDPKPDARQMLDKVLENARLALPALADVGMPPEGRLSFADSLADAVSGASWIQESVPEDLALKRKVIRTIQEHAGDDAVIGSSTSGFRPGQLQDGAVHPSRILVAHPFNPVYLLPLVEVVPGAATSSEFAARACNVLSSIGMKPLLVRKEIDAHIADRLLEAVWREALWLVRDDIATTAEIDDAIRYGFGLRWAQMGLFETYRLAGGEAGMAHFIEQFGPALQWPWTKLTDVPELTPDLVKKIADQSDAQSGHSSVRELERVRDSNLVGMMRALKERNWGAGALLNEHDRRLTALPAKADAKQLLDAAPLRMLDLSVLPGWIDYNGHMSDYRYAQVFSDTSDRLLAVIGMDQDYVLGGCSYYTVESHIIYKDEIGVNEPIYTTSQLLMADRKRLHVFHRLHSARDDRLLASAEEMFLHVNRQSGRVCEAGSGIVEKAMALAKAHSQLPAPDGIGRSVGERRRG